MHPPYEKGRYITLLGHPIGPKGPKSLAASFLERAEFKTGGVATVLTALFNEAVLSMTLDQVAETAFNVGKCNLAECVVLPFLEKKALLGIFFSKQTLNEKCIDTRPDRNTVPTLDRYGLPARNVRWMYAVLGGMSAVSDMIEMPVAQNPFHVLTRTASFYTRMYSGYNRFNKVAKGDWVIVDMPEQPEKRREADPVLMPAMTR